MRTDRWRRWPFLRGAQASVGVLAMVGALLALVMAVAVAEWFGWPFLARPLQHWLAEASARPVSLSRSDEDPVRPTTPFRIRFLGGVWLTAPHLEIGAPGWSTSPHLLQASDVTLRLRYIDLWRASQGEVLRVDQLAARVLDVHLERRADGRVSWQLGPDRPSGLAPLPPVPVPTFGRLAVNNGVLHYTDVPRALNFLAQMSLTDDRRQTQATTQAPSGSAGRMVVSAKGHYRDRPVMVELVSTGALPWQAEDVQMVLFPLTVKAMVGRARLTFKGMAADALHLRSLRGQFSLSGPSLAAVGDPFGVTLPTTAAFQSGGTVLKKGSIWLVEVAHGTVGASRLRGAFTYDTAPRVPVLSGHLGGARLWLPDLGPVVGATTAATDAVDGRVLPDRPFDLPALRVMDANVLIDIAEIDLNTAWLEPLRPLRGHLRLQAGVLTLSGLDTRTAQGHLVGKLRLDGRGAKALWTADLQWRGVRLERWIRRAQHTAMPTLVSGRLNGSAVLQGQGRSTADILATLKGRTRAELVGGAVSHLGIEVAGLDLAQSLGVLIEGDHMLAVPCAVADLSVAKGVIQPRVMVLDTADSAIWVEGAVSLASEALDLRVVVMPKDFSPLTLRMPLLVQGTFAHPRVSLETGAMGAKLAAAFLLALVNPLAAVLPLIDPGDGPLAERGAAGCEGLMKRMVPSK